ncbi:MAG: CopG family transcriptional regulator [Acidobacteria bacterium]|nr:CopG family transcriptional regulator [Acidobacteriota bacterium]MBI3472781.1 CopG family transcriptional regulator [Candidatus Solibacter usitatus]
MADTEKVSFNMSVVDLGQVDLLVRQGFYSGRTDFFVAAVRSLLQKHAATVQQEVARRSMTLGVAAFGRPELEQAASQGEPLDIRVVGVLTIQDDVSVELARAAIRSVSVFGKFLASPEIKALFLPERSRA